MEWLPKVTRFLESRAGFEPGQSFSKATTLQNESRKEALLQNKNSDALHCGRLVTEWCRDQGSKVETQDASTS